MYKEAVAERYDSIRNKILAEGEITQVELAGQVTVYQVEAKEMCVPRKEREHAMC